MSGEVQLRIALNLHVQLDRELCQISMCGLAADCVRIPPRDSSDPQNYTNITKECPENVRV